MKKTITILTLFITILSFGQEIKFGKVSKAALEEKFYPLDSTANAVYLYRYRKTYYNYSQNTGYEIVTEIHNRIKIYNKEGFDKANEMVGYYSNGDNREMVTSIKGYTYVINNGKQKRIKLSKKDIFDDKRNENFSVKKITLPNIKEGAIVEYKYRLVSPRYWYIRDLQFQFDIPVKKLDYIIETPERFVFNKIPKGYYLVDFKETKRNGTVSLRNKTTTTTTYSGAAAGGKTVSSSYNTQDINIVFVKSTYQENDIPALKGGEPFVSDIRNYRGGMKYELSAINIRNSAPKLLSVSWGDVVKGIYKSEFFGGQLKNTSFFKDDLQILLADIASDNEKITAILELVKSKVKWNGNDGKYANVSIKKAYKEGVGNVGTINLLLTAMLREAGFDANPVLTSTRSYGIPVSPTNSGFNYVISSVSLPSGDILLDATDEYSTVNVLPFRVMNWRGRLVRDNIVSSWVSLIPKRHRLDDNFISVKVSDDGMVEGMVRTKYAGLSALNYRKRNNPIKEEDVISKIEEDYDIEIDNFKVTNEKNLNKPLARLFKFSSEDLVEQISGKLYISPLLFFAMKTNPLKANERKYPVDFGIPWKNKNTVTIEIPEGYKVETIPTVAAIGLPDGIGLFKFQAKQVGNKIKINSLLQFNKGTILPNYYSQLKEFFKQVVEKQTEKIVFVKS
ncbi:MAG: DUF3857 domain-containing protein [Flavobacteriaceae bacterium]